MSANTKESREEADKLRAALKEAMMAADCAEARGEELMREVHYWVRLKQKFAAMASKAGILSVQNLKAQEKIGVLEIEVEKLRVSTIDALRRTEALELELETKWRPLLDAAEDVVYNPEQYAPEGDPAWHRRLEVLRQKVEDARK